MGRNKKTLVDYHELASSRGFVCLASEIKNANTLVGWKCSENHEWMASHNNIRRGKGCPHCAGLAKKTFKDYRKLAESRGFILLSDENEIKNNSIPVSWKCPKGHEWKSRYGSIKQGKGCPHCAGNIQKTLKDYHGLAESRGFVCLVSENEIKNGKTSVSWQCPEGHEWAASYHNINRGRGCPQCSHHKSSGESEIYQEVVKLYPDAISTDRKVLSPKELDILVPSLRKAIEVDGAFWHYSEWAIAKGAQERDLVKNNLCKEKGIDLLRIVHEDYLKNKEVVLRQVFEFLGRGDSQ